MHTLSQTQKKGTIATSIRFASLRSPKTNPRLCIHDYTCENVLYVAHNNIIIVSFLSTSAQKNRLASGLANGDRPGGVQLLYGHAVSTGVAVPSATARHPSLEEPAEKGDLCDLRNMFVVVLVAFWVHFANRPMTMTQEWSEWIGPVPQTENTISQTHQLAGGVWIMIWSGAIAAVIASKNVRLPIVILKKHRRVFLFTSLVNMGISSHGDLCCAERIFADMYRTCFICIVRIC